LVVEVDGSQHADTVEQDAARTSWLAAKGCHVTRFWNDEVLQNTEGVLEAILRALNHEE
jgi:very-short-patch-repair endonuclease